MRTSRRAALVMLAIFLSAIALVGTASAHTQRHRDPDDSRGRFDIAAVKTIHHGDKIRFEVTLYDTLHLGDVDLRLDRYFFIGLDLDQRAGDRSCSSGVLHHRPPSAKAIATDCVAIAGRVVRPAPGPRRSAKRRSSTSTSTVTSSTPHLVFGDASCPGSLRGAHRRPLYLEDRLNPVTCGGVAPTSRRSDRVPIKDARLAQRSESSLVPTCGRPC